MEYVYNFIYEQIQSLQDLLSPEKHPIIISLKESDDYYSDDVNNLINSVEKEIKLDKELELLQIRYSNLVKDVDEIYTNKEEDDDESKDDDDKDNGKVGLKTI